MTAPFPQSPMVSSDLKADKSSFAPLAGGEKSFEHGPTVMRLEAA
jgi:hypothetical protein